MGPSSYTVMGPRSQDSPIQRWSGANHKFLAYYVVHDFPLYNGYALFAEDFVNPLNTSLPMPLNYLMVILFAEVFPLS